MGEQLVKKRGIWNSLKRYQSPVKHCDLKRKEKMKMWGFRQTINVGWLNMLGVRWTFQHVENWALAKRYQTFIQHVRMFSIWWRGNIVEALFGSIFMLDKLDWRNWEWRVKTRQNWRVDSKATRERLLLQYCTGRTDRQGHISLPLWYFEKWKTIFPLTNLFYAAS